MLVYDNVEDARSKLYNTLCYYGGKVIHITDVISKQPVVEDQQPQIYVYGKTFNARSKIGFSLDDPKFNCFNYNLGYSNFPYGACWWYRLPIKQYQQGLKGIQLAKKASNPNFLDIGWGFSTPIINMLERIYPTFDEAEKTLKDGDAPIVGFNKNFAVSWDRIHRDLLVEYKGTTVGYFRSQSDFQLLEEYEFLTEALRESINAHR